MWLVLRLLTRHLFTEECPIQVQAAAVVVPLAATRADENFAATVMHADGAAATLLYVALGDRTYPKERMDIFVDGKVISLDDYRQVVGTGLNRGNWNAAVAQMGQKEGLIYVADSLLQGISWPISLSE